VNSFPPLWAVLKGRQMVMNTIPKSVALTKADSVIDRGRRSVRQFPLKSRKSSSSGMGLRAVLTALIVRAGPASGPALSLA